MTLVKFNRPLAKSMDLMDDFFGDFPTIFNRTFNGEPGRQGAVNITETNEGYRLEMMLPGRKKEDFRINMDRNLLTISYEKKEEQETNDQEKSIRREFSFESFKRTFTLDEKIDAEKISAKYENGILMLELPKKEELKVQPKEIEIK
jgi:HSP20 family protein